VGHLPALKLWQGSEGSWATHEVDLDNAVEVEGAVQEVSLGLG
jgi:hypothetical protein